MRSAFICPASAPTVLLFLGGAPELAVFTRGLERTAGQRYVVCLSDVDGALLEGLPSGARVPLIFAQVVPNPHSNTLAVVRRYRAVLATLFDEAPSPDADDAYRRVLAELTLTNPSFSLRGGTREILRGIIARGLGLR